MDRRKSCALANRCSPVNLGDNAGRPADGQYNQAALVGRGWVALAVQRSEHAATPVGFGRLD
jgi:hypothetical protein